MPGPPHRPETIPALAREQFPALTADPGVVYLDSAATTQKPRPVIDAVTAALSGQTANPGRGSYPWSARGARRIAEVREQAARFIGAAGADEIVFTTGATAGLNAVALSWGLANLADGDEILYSPHDHTSNVYPWVRLRQLLARFGRRVSLVPYTVTAAGEADTADIAAKVSPRTRLITVTHVHHVFGGLTTLEELRGRLSPSVRLCFDCTQSAGHIPLDVARLGCDFAVLSGHKMFGVAGTGVLYARRRVHHELTPFLPGGGSGVQLAGDGLHGLRLDGLRMPDGLEGGTPDLPGISALGAAMEFIDECRPGADRRAQPGADPVPDRPAGRAARGDAAARPGLGCVPGRLRDRLVPPRRGAQRRRRVRAELAGVLRAYRESLHGRR